MKINHLKQTFYFINYKTKYNSINKKIKIVKKLCSKTSSQPLYSLAIRGYSGYDEVKDELVCRRCEKKLPFTTIVSVYTNWGDPTSTDNDVWWVLKCPTCNKKYLVEKKDLAESEYIWWIYYFANCVLNT